MVISVPVTPSVSPEPGETMVGHVCNGLVKVYASKERVKLMFADPTDPGNPQKRSYIAFDRHQAKDLSALIREASFRIVT